MKISWFNYLMFCLHFINKNFPSLTSIEKILDRPIFLNPRSKQDFSSDKSHFYCIPPRDVQNKFSINRNLCRFPTKPNFLYDIWWKTRFSYCQVQTLYGLNSVKHKLNMDLIPNDWKQLIRTETSRKSLCITRKMSIGKRLPKTL